MLQAFKNGNKAFARRLIALKATIFTSGNKSNSSHNNNNKNNNYTNNNSSETTTSENQNSPTTPQLQNQQQQQQQAGDASELDTSDNKIQVSEMSEVSKSSSNNSTTPANNDGESGELIKTGWLLKWTNYLKGYQKRWFVLSNGVLSYYRYVRQKESQGFSLCIAFRVLNIVFFYIFFALIHNIYLYHTLFMS